MTRDLVCNTCREQVTLLGDDLDYIDPDLYHCPTCREPTGETIQLDLDGRTETLTGYRPDMAEIPF